MAYKGQDSQCAVARHSDDENPTRPSTVDQQPSGVVQDVEPGESIEKTEVRGQAGDRNYKEVVDTDKSTEPTVPVLAQDFKMLEFALGDISENDGGASGAPYTHKITEADTLPTFCMEEAQFNTNENNNDLIRTFIGCVVDSVEISTEDGGLMDMEFSLQAVDFNTDQPSEDATSLISKRPFAHKDLKTLTHGGTTVPHAAGVTIEIENNLEELPDNGAIVPSFFEAMNREYTVTLSYNPDDDVHYESFINSTNGNLVVEYERSTDDSVKFEFSNAEFEEPGTDAPSEDLVEGELVATAKSCTVTVTNSSETYSLS